MFVADFVAVRVTPKARTSSRLLPLLAASVGVGVLMMALQARSIAANGYDWPLSVFHTAVADTDSVAVEDAIGNLLDAAQDSTDALPADTTDADSLAHVYFPTPRREGYTSPLTSRRTRPFSIDLGSYWRREAVLDSAEFRYIITEDVAQQDVRVPADVDLETYREARLRDGLQLGFRDLASRRVRRRGRGGFGITIDIPGGNQSAFSSLFGKNEVDLRVNGQADIDLGFDYQRNELTEASTGSGGSVNPDFGQELSLGITGTIGDKMRINVNYDTQNTFDFENQVSLVYEGYDDDIIQRIEAGNVFLQSPSELIRGGQRLFGLRTDLQFGGLGITLVASQQDAESDALIIEGGSQTTEFSLAPYKYEDNAHFFLAYHFRNWWNEGHKDPINRTLSPGFATLTGIEVWIHDRTVVNTTGSENERVYATALLDLGEPGPGNNIPGAPPNGVLAGGDAYLAGLDINAPLPNELLDQYSDDDLNVLRDSSSQVIIEDAFGLQSSDFETAPFRRLHENVDYTVDLYSGYLSLTSRLQEDDMLAVSYQFLAADGTPVTVGDFGEGSNSGSSNGDKIILKLLRGRLPQPSNASWALTMRNIYRVGGRSLRADAFDVDVSFKPSGSTPQRTLPGVTIGLQQTLLQTLGLDRLNRDGAAQPDDVFDFREGQTIDAGSGRIIFPVREPFGAYLRSVINGEVEGLDISFLATNAEDAIGTFVFDTLYSTRSDAADRISNINNYAIAGSFRSSVQSVYELGFAIVEGSVSVTSGSIELQEGVDYTVNDASGTVEITNPAFLSPGQNLRIDYERNQFLSIGSKTLLGLRANYALGDELQLGATWMRLSERPLIDKYRIGEEPLSNTIWGVDGRFEAEPRWLTRAIDALPLLQTRAPSRFELKAEFAQLNPGHPETFAFNQERDALNALSRDFYEDELTGLSFIDDFEGVENVFSLLQPGAWRLAAAPSGSGPDPDNPVQWTAGTPVTEPLLPSNWRGLFSWYSVLASTYRGDLCSEVDCTSPATRQLGIREIFPDREVRSGEPETLTTLDLYIDPRGRGPYNYNGEFETTYNANPQTAWGGMVQRLPEGYTDFGGRNNIEFVEFIFSPLGGRNGTEEIASGAVLHIDLGEVSEDVIPNRQFNNEDGLRELPIEPGNSDAWGRLPDGQTSTTVDYDDATGQTEDLGLDGLRSSLVNPGGTDYETDERTFFSEFLAGLSQGSMEQLRANEDPSADDFHHFDDTGYFNNGNRFEGGRATLQERFSRFFPGLELNSFESQQKISDAGTTGNSRQPDSEDLNGNQSLDATERHFRYTIPLNDDSLRASPFFQNDIVTESGQTWYVVRIPVRSEERESIGGIEDFSSIEFMRIWSTGHDKPATLRFATLEIVGSQWLKSDNVGIDDRPAGTIPARVPPRLFIETINNEENPNQYAIPIGALVSRTPDISGNLIRQREQSLVFRVENLPEETSRAIYKPFSTNSHDLTKYSNLRMFTHAEGFEERDSVRVFIRLGDNQTEDYYEYEQPVYPYVIPDGQTVNADSLWQTNVPVGTGTVDRNSINVVLSELNQLKVERDDDPSIPRDERYSNNRTPDGAPPRTRITIRGNPSIQSINTIAIGVRNAAGGTTAPLENVEVWFNELRVTGYDEESGWSAYARATLQLADVASINARFSQQTDGFGELGSSLGGRSFSDKQDYSVLATFNAHKFLPERFGWSMPISLSIQQSQSTPRFSPRRGDIRVEELLAQAEEDPDLTQAERQDRVDQIIGESETSTFSRSIRIPLSKSGSRSPWLRYTIDGVSLVYTNSASRSRSPFSQFGDSDRWSASFTYRLSVPRARSVRPFWFVEKVPVLGILGKLRLNYLPQSFTFSADADRSVTDNRERPIDEVINNPVNQGVPERFLYPTRRDHQFGHGRTFDLAYNPFTFLALSFRSDVDQSLDGAGAEAGFNLFVRDSLGTTREYDISDEEAFAAGGIARQDFGIPDSLSVNDLRNLGYIIQEITALDVLPLGEVLGGVFNGERRVLTNSYLQNVTGTFQPQFDRVQFLRWLRPQPITYGSRFAWNYSQEVDDTIVANVNTSSTIRGGLQLRPREFWRLFSFYRNIEQAEQQGNRGRGDNRGRGRDQPTDEGELPEGEQADDEGQEDAEERRRPRLPNLASIGRKLFLAVTGVEDFTITYNGTRSTAASGLRGNNFSLYDALLGEGPSLRYRLSLERRIPLRDRILSEGLQFHDILGNGHHVNARTTIRLTPELNVNLTWDANWDQNEDITLEIENGDLVERPAVERGGGHSTIVAFGGSYESLLELHRRRYEADAAAGGAAQDTLISDVLTRSGLAADFQSAFASGMGSFGPRGFFVVPLPNWEINYTGLSRWPLFRALANQVTLRHGYSATYDLSYNSNLAVGTSTSENIQVPLAGGGTTNQTLISEIPFREPSTAIVNERFQPLLGVNVTWKGGLQTDFSWSRSNARSLSAASASISENTTKELSLRLTYSKTGLRIPLFGRRRLNNNLRFTLTLARSNNNSFVHFLKNDLEDILGGSELTPPQDTGSQRLTVEPRLSYAISNQVNMDVFVRYETIDSRGSQIPSTSLINGGFAFRVSFSN